MIEEAALAAAEVTVSDLFEAQVTCHPQAIAIQNDGLTLTYAELRDQIDRLCSLLISHGVRRGARVAILSENRWEFLALLLANARLGSISVCMNWRQSVDELDHCARLVEPDAAFFSPRFAEHVPLLEAAGAEHVFELGPDLDALLDAVPLATPPERVRVEDGFQIIYTSGTTGKPKAALISHRATIARGMLSASDGVVPRGSTFLAWPPMFHMAGTETSLLTLFRGGKVIVIDGAKVDLLCDLIASEDNLAWVQLMPGMIDRVIDELKARGVKPKPMHMVGSMPDFLPRHFIAEATRFFNAPFRNTFGSSECGPVPVGGSFVPVGVVPDNLDKSQASLCRLRFVDEEGRDVAEGEPGELLVRGPTLFSGYWNAPEVNREVFADGWFHTGDVMVRTAEGKLRFVDRRKYLIKSGGENIYPSEIESVLMSSPRVQEAIVVRRRDAKWGEVPVAFVVPKDPLLTEAEAIDLCRGRIANYKLPRQVLFVSDAEIPRNVTGKPLRNELEARLPEPAA